MHVSQPTESRERAVPRARDYAVVVRRPRDMSRRATVRARALAVVKTCLFLALAALPAALYALDPMPRPLVERQLQQATTAVLDRNIYAHGTVLYPSPAYYNPYLRDSFWAAQALGSRRFSISVLNAFAAAERSDGDPPTMFVNAYRYPRYHDDESAALLLIWAYRNQTLYGAPPPHSSLQRALDYLMARSRDGFLITPPGLYGGWIDALRLPAADTLSYSQGLYAVALRCAARLGLSLPPDAVAAAERAYRLLYNPWRGYLGFSRRIPATDSSALTGEFLSLWLFHHPMLSDHMVLRTLHSLTPFGAGFRNLDMPAGAGLLSSGTDVHFGVPGDYQNGASWLLFDALTLGAAGLHGLPDARARLQARVAQEFRHGVVLREYLRTDPSLPYFGSEPPNRDFFAWDSFVSVIDVVLRQRRS